MYWPRIVKTVRSVDSLDQVLRENSNSIGDTFGGARSGRINNQETTSEEEEEELEEIEGTSKLKRSKSYNKQPQKKISTPNIQNLNIQDGTSSISIFAGVTQPDQDIDMAAAAFDHNGTWARIKQLAITSKHYTARDKNEIMAQEPTFDALDDLVTMSQACNTDGQHAERKARLERLISNAQSQLKLYYLVGSEGWATAVTTIKSSEAARLGVPEPVHIAKPTVVYVNPRNSYNNQQSFGYSNKKKSNYGRRPFKKD